MIILFCELLTAEKLSAAHAAILKQKRRFQDNPILRQIKHRWFHPSLQGDSDETLYVCLDMLCLVTLDQYKELKKYIDKKDTAKQCTLRKTKATSRSFCRCIGHLFRYPLWMVKTPIETVEHYSNTPIYSMRSKVSLSEKQKQARRDYKEHRRQKKLGPFANLTGFQKEYFESIQDIDYLFPSCSWQQMDLDAALYEAQAKKITRHARYIRGQDEDIKGHLLELRDHCHFWSDLFFNDTFRSEEACHNYLLKGKWPQGFRCPKCGKRACRRLANNQYLCLVPC